MPIFLALGTNIGNKLKNLKKAIQLLERNGVNVTKSSSIYKTSPYGPIEQDWFLNQVIEIKTALSPEKLLEVMQDIEKGMGRKRKSRWGPRIIDLDILFYGETVISKKHLTIPHADLENRIFVLQPLCDIASNFVHPIFETTMQELLDECMDDSEIEKLDS